MVKILILLLFASLSVKAELPDPPLFQVNTPSGKSYLLGTIHVGVDLSEFPMDVEALIRSSRLVLPELSMAEEEIKLYKNDPFQVLYKYNPFNQANLDNGSKLRLKQLGYPDYLVDTLGDSDCGVFNPLIEIRKKRVPMDMQVLAIAHSHAVPTQALDTMEIRRQARRSEDQQRGSCSLKLIFDSYSNDQLILALENGDNESIRSYRQGDAIPLEELNSPLVVERNLKWLSTLEKEILQGQAFIAVGVAHLFGPQGLIELLKAKGYSIRQVKAKR